MIPIHDDNPTELRPIVTIALIATCCAVYVWQLTGGYDDTGANIYRFGMIPAVLLGTEVLPPDLAVVPPWTTLFSSMFLHADLIHIGSNLLYLWIFGNNVEDAMGHWRFIVFYLLCGVAASFGQIVLDTSSVAPVIGASGAISGVLGAYLMLYPQARIKLFFPMIFITVFHMRAVWVLGLWIVWQLVGSSLVPADADAEEGGIAYGAHLGGFIAGMLLIGLFKSRDIPLRNPLQALFRERPQHPETTAEVSKPTVDATPDQARSTPERETLDDLAQDRGRLSDLE